MAAYDVRGIANFVLDRAAGTGRIVSNLSLNKIVYFLHQAFLENYKSPLVAAKIEAWDHGPVFREIYHQFKNFGKSPITSRAKKIDLETRSYLECSVDIEEDHRKFLLEICDELLNIPAGKLVDMSHVVDGPWHKVRHGSGPINPGMKISDELILRHASEQLRH